MLSSLHRVGRFIKRSDLGLQVITCRMHHITNITIAIPKSIKNKIENSLSRRKLKSQTSTQSNYTSSLLPSGNVCQKGINSTMWSLTLRRQSISLRHISFFSQGIGSSLHNCPNTVATCCMKFKFKTLA